MTLVAPSKRPVRVTCDACGGHAWRTRQRVIQHRSDNKPHTKGRPSRMLCHDCLIAWHDSLRRYHNPQERKRESKRRERAVRHAKGLTSDGVPYKSQATRMAAAKQYVAPEGGG